MNAEEKKYLRELRQQEARRWGEDSTSTLVTGTTSQDSGWVKLYTVCGAICAIAGLIGLVAGAVGGDGGTGFVFFCTSILAALSCALGAHVLRLLEKCAHHSKRTADAIERLIV